MTLTPRTSSPSRPHPQRSGSRRSGWRKTLWSEQQRRARTAWLIALPLLAAHAALIVVGSLFSDLLTPILAALVTGSAAAAATTVVLVSRRILGARRGLTDYGLAIDRRWLCDLGAGLLLGVASPAVPFLVAITTGAVTVEAAFDGADRENLVTQAPL